jgi:GH18 family chitinase
MNLYYLGWNEGSQRFSALVASSDRRAQFVKNSIKFLRQNKFDGLDLDWGIIYNLFMYKIQI